MSVSKILTVLSFIQGLIIQSLHGLPSVEHGLIGELTEIVFIAFFIAQDTYFSIDGRAKLRSGISHKRGL